jgi:hypothetical protein
VRKVAFSLLGLKQDSWILWRFSKFENVRLRELLSELERRLAGCLWCRRWGNIFRELNAAEATRAGEVEARGGVLAASTLTHPASWWFAGALCFGNG